ncbi:MAG: restriction endonuclease subunit S [Helicobacteraceae bacterium]
MGGEFREFRLDDLFESFSGNFDIQKEHINGRGEYVITAGLGENGVLGRSDIEAKIFDADTITIDMFGNAFYRGFEYKMVTHARVFCLKPLFKINGTQGLFLATALHFLKYKFGYENMCSWAKIKAEKIFLPTLGGEIAFTFMENFIKELEREHVKELKDKRTKELNAYFAVTGLRNYALNQNELDALATFNEISKNGGGGGVQRCVNLKSAICLTFTLQKITA